MKKITLLLLLLTSTIAIAQQLYVEGGKTSTSFDYENSQGSSLENLQATSNSYMEVGYRNQLFTENLHLNVGLDYVSYGAIGSDIALGNYMEWNVNYAGLNLGLDYNLFHIKKASVYLKGGMSAGFFVQGTQTFNNNVIDLKNNDDFDTTLISIKAGVGFSHPISENLSFYVQYLYGKSLDMASGDAELKIASNKVGFGLLINLSKKEATGISID
ncbi:outer membrane beta-barrel protein [Lutibacter sp. A64]|uniref:outer membrane protein n=1 Tax=Lutibacter sp. A64 TaxID=2918526 RepID=UPI001F0610F9|nr:outer membrane beta-barrel protein [Lutibacter sp. A64]UMB54379.1 outer membrane beta-barrel protein [Lutibacter sp. A64]